MNRRGFAALAIIIIIAAVALAGLILVITHPKVNLQAQNPSGTLGAPSSTATQSLTADIPGSSAVLTAGWKTYTNQQYGFSLKYPSDWDLRTDGLKNTLGSTSSMPFIALGHPLSGMADYTLFIYIFSNPKSLSSKDYVQAMIARAKQADDLAQQNGDAPDSAPRFDKEYAVTVNSYPGYELYNVFEYDRGGEQIYVANNQEVVKFDFAVAEANQNLSSPVENNAIAHRILSTFSFLPSSSARGTGAFCGGIAAGAFQCSKGYTCIASGTYPDAGGTCKIENVSPPPGTMCAQHVVTAKNTATGEVHDFPTPCQVPEGWVSTSEPVPTQANCPCWDGKNNICLPQSACE